jgi:hypothetical protein
VRHTYLPENIPGLTILKISALYMHIYEAVR